MYMSLSNIAVLNISSVDSRCIINEAVNLLQKVDLNEKGGTL